MRRLFDHAFEGDLDVASREAFEKSGWMATRRQFETDTVPLTALFPEPRYASSQSRAGSHADWKTLSISAFQWNVARNPAGFNLDRAVSIIADHAPNKIRREWIQGRTSVDHLLSSHWSMTKVMPMPLSSRGGF